jgi:hypothetical protein
MTTGNSGQATGCAVLTTQIPGTDERWAIGARKLTGNSK